MNEINLALGHSETQVLVQSGILKRSGEAFCCAFKTLHPFPIVVISDERVAGLYLDLLEDSLRQKGFHPARILIPACEQAKCIAEATKLFEFLHGREFPRDGCVVALGGGVVSDLAGFVAGTWMRGTRFVICPTTLEADIDACLGGKTAVNFLGGKNLIGMFHPASLVLIDPDCLKTLEARDVRSGLAESVKHALIASEEFLSWHDENLENVLRLEPAATTELLVRNLRIKADIVRRDPFELTGDRLVLNFGHTIGHAIEDACGYALRHGECVGLGMVAACRLSERVGLSPAVSARVSALLGRIGLPLSVPAEIGVEAILRSLRQDKKIRDGRLSFVLLEGIGQPVVRADVSEPAALEAIEQLYA